MGRILSVLVFLAVCVTLTGVACATPATGTGDEKSGGNEGGGGIAARVGDQTISLDDVDQKAKTANTEVYQQLYTARRQVLDQMIAELLLEQEAEERGNEVSALITEEIASKAGTVSDADVQAFFEKNQSRMGNQTVEQMSGRIREFLTNQNNQQARGTYLTSLKKKAGVQIILDPPRVEVQIAENDPRKGPADAPILLVEFSEFQ
jgi:hypothetical protein